MTLQGSAPEPSPSIAATRERAANDTAEPFLIGLDGATHRRVAPLGLLRSSPACVRSLCDAPRITTIDSCTQHRARSFMAGRDQPREPRARAINVLATERKTRIETENWDDLAMLVRRAQVGDREAFGRLVEQFQQTVHAICLRRLRHPSEAMELTQEVFLHVMRRIGQLREPERFAGWLRQVTVRMAINRATRRTAPPSVETSVLEAAGVEGERVDPLDALIIRERAQRLWEAMGRLKRLDRETLVAFYIQGQSLIEMADQLDVPLGTVKRRLHTARKRLKIELLALAVDHEDWVTGEVELNEPENDGSMGDWQEPEALLVGAGGAAW
ncbi:MAG: sigma-70 family RNA polymerase sigma factor [Isosphaeraceae bacterium]